MKQLHDLQIGILKNLLFSSGLRYLKLKPSQDIENNQFDFHLNRLIDMEWVTKKENRYFLTNKGKEVAGLIDTDHNKITKQAKLSMMICCLKTVGKRRYYLIHTRQKQPFYGCQGFFSGKLSYGEKIKDAAQRELKEETGLVGKPEIIGLKHYLVFDPTTKQLVEDKFMFVYKVENPKGDLVGSGPEGIYKWVEEDQLETYVKYHYESIPAFMKQVQAVANFSGQIVVEEIVDHSTKF